MAAGAVHEGEHQARLGLPGTIAARATGPTYAELPRIPYPPELRRTPLLGTSVKSDEGVLHQEDSASVDRERGITSAR